MKHLCKTIFDIFHHFLRYFKIWKNKPSWLIIIAIKRGLVLTASNVNSCEIMEQKKIIWVNVVDYENEFKGIVSISVSHATGWSFACLIIQITSVSVGN